MAMYVNSEIERAWDTLMELGVSEETLQVVTSINGYTLETLEDVLYATEGSRSFDQLDDWEEEEEEEEEEE